MLDEQSQHVEVPPSLLSMESLQQARVMPWKASNELRRWLILPLAWWTLRNVRVGLGLARVTACRSFSAIVRVRSGSVMGWSCDLGPLAIPWEPTIQ